MSIFGHVNFESETVLTMHATKSDVADRHQACAMMPHRPAKNAVLRFRFSSQVLSIFCENAVQRAVKVYSEVETIKVNTEC
jgi:hypothetical protein